MLSRLLLINHHLLLAHCLGGAAAGAAAVVCGTRRTHMACHRGGANATRLRWSLTIMRSFACITPIGATRGDTGTWRQTLCMMWMMMINGLTTVTTWLRMGTSAGGAIRWRTATQRGSKGTMSCIHFTFLLQLTTCQGVASVGGAAGGSLLAGGTTECRCCWLPGW